MELTKVNQAEAATGEPLEIAPEIIPAVEPDDDEPEVQE
jgi:hypothetical protein